MIITCKWWLFFINFILIGFSYKFSSHLRFNLPVVKIKLCLKFNLNLKFNVISFWENKYEPTVTFKIKFERRIFIFIAKLFLLFSLSLDLSLFSNALDILIACKTHCKFAVFIDCNAKKVRSPYFFLENP